MSAPNIDPALIVEVGPRVTAQLMTGQDWSIMLDRFFAQELTDRCGGSGIDRCIGSYVCSHCIPGDLTECLGGICPDCQGRMI